MLNKLLKTVVTGAAMATMVATGAAVADDYPNRPITMIIPFGPGGSHDLNARVITSTIPEHLGQAMVVRLMPGGTQIGTAAAAEAPADGYTLLFTHNFIDQLQPLVTDVPYDTNRDFVTVATLNNAAPVIAVREDSRFETMEQLIEWSRENPGQLRFGHGGNWGALMVPGAMLMQEAGFQATLVPHQGGGPAMRALLAGDIDMTPTLMSIAVGQGDAIRILATFSEERIIDDVPTLRELGYNISTPASQMQRVLLAPSGIPEDRLAKLRAAFEELQENQTYHSLMARLEENTDFIPGEEYDRIRLEQREIYQALADAMLGR
ncbi:Bug family tripartite tricarboxylate transporter substrate binding protein [Alkalilacustris brevis]|uniref:Bug family tripartite tricarboxylate transporter substrate binding protein n=1 Tax=Alkalilacustris brevis TaxID=2026338 RepID=UPI0013901392|nr:tripartite tricarboxylate transporter substrate binding protein [Alkalilacustris brevis]